MSISFVEQQNSDNKPVGVIHIDNGDYEALKGAMEQYGFINQEALLRYALVALLNSPDNKLYIKQEDGNIVALNISEKLIKGKSE